MILEARDFLVSEAPLTGESYPVEKAPGPVPADAPAAKRTNSVFLGTSVRSGTAKVLVAETGTRTMLGGIAGRLLDAETETEFSRGLRQFGYLLTRVMIAVALAVSSPRQIAPITSRRYLGWIQALSLFCLS